MACYECGVQGHFKRECPKLKNNNNHGNQSRRNNAPARVYAVGRAWTDLDANVVMVIVYAEKIVRIPWENETLIIHGDGSNQGNMTRLSIISCTKMEKLYHLEQDKDCLIINRIVYGQWKWNWSRKDIGDRNTAYMRDMLLEISQVDLNAVDDHCVWTMAKDDIFSVGESRRIIDSKLLPSLVPSTSLDNTLSRKVNIFI
nr:RNA-directed DNA polymerase, eukaryota [Tanacetum cinerariifolium]